MEVCHTLASDSPLIPLRGADMSVEGRGWDHKLAEEVLPGRTRELQLYKKKIHSAMMAQIVGVAAAEPSIGGTPSEVGPLPSCPSHGNTPIERTIPSRPGFQI